MQLQALPTLLQELGSCSDGLARLAARWHSACAPRQAQRTSCSASAELGCNSTHNPPAHPSHSITDRTPTVCTRRGLQFPQLCYAVAQVDYMKDATKVGCICSFVLLHGP